MQIRLLGNHVMGRLKWDMVLNETESEVRETFVFKDWFIEEAQDVLGVARDWYKDHLEAVKQVKNKKTKGQSKSKSRRKKKRKDVDITYVGVHVR